MISNKKIFSNALNFPQDLKVSHLFIWSKCRNNCNKMKKRVFFHIYRRKIVIYWFIDFPPFSSLLFMFVIYTLSDILPSYSSTYLDEIINSYILINDRKWKCKERRKRKNFPKWKIFRYFSRTKKNEKCKLNGSEDLIIKK